jgi:hypothetical protein
VRIKIGKIDGVVETIFASIFAIRIIVRTIGVNREGVHVKRDFDRLTNVPTLIKHSQNERGARRPKRAMVGFTNNPS